MNLDPIMTITATRKLTHWLEIEYMTGRVHSALGFLTPAECEALAFNQPEALLLIP